GAEPTNTIAHLYDERRLHFRQIHAPGTPVQATTQFDYDKNGNLVATSQGLESQPRVTTAAYDGYDRRVSETDAMGGITSQHFDANGNLLNIRLDGLPDGSGNHENVRLTSTTHVYDAMDRRTSETTSFFNAKTQQPIGTG